MRLFGDFICGASHWMAEVVDDKYQSTILSLRHNNSVILLKQTLFEEEMSATRRYDSLFDLWLVHLANLISVNTRAVDNDLGLNGELFAFRIKFVYAHASYNLTCLVLDEAFEFDVVGESRARLSWSIPVHSRCKEGVKVHPRIMHLRLGHHGAVVAVEGLAVWVLVPQLLLPQQTWP